MKAVDDFKLKGTQFVKIHMTAMAKRKARDTDSTQDEDPFAGFDMDGMEVGHFKKNV